MALSTENPPQSQVTIESPATGIALAKLGGMRAYPVPGRPPTWVEEQSLMAGVLAALALSHDEDCEFNLHDSTLRVGNECCFQMNLQHSGIKLHVESDVQPAD